MARPLKQQVISEILALYEKDPYRWLKQGWAQSIVSGLPRLVNRATALAKPEHVVRACLETEIYLVARSLIEDETDADKLASSVCASIAHRAKHDCVPNFNDEAKGLAEIVEVLEAEFAA